MLKCLSILLGPSQKFDFEEFFQSNKLIKFEFSERGGLKPSVKVFGKNQAIIAQYTQYTATMHTKTKQAATIRVLIENNTPKPMDVYFKLEDVSKDEKSTLGPINESEMVSDLKSVFQNIILSQRMHLKKQKEHENLLKSSKKRMILLLILEGLFCGLMEIGRAHV